MLGAAVEGEKSGPINKPQDQKPLFFLNAPLHGEGCAARCLLAKCLWRARDAQSNKLVEDSAGRLRPTAAARMNGNSLRVCNRPGTTYIGALRGRSPTTTTSVGRIRSDLVEELDLEE